MVLVIIYFHKWKKQKIVFKSFIKAQKLGYAEPGKS